MCRVTDNQNLVPFLYHKYFEKYSPFYEDLMSSGYLGLVKADKRYNGDYAFTTFASKCIINEMRFFLRKELKHYNNRVDDIEPLSEIVGYTQKFDELDCDKFLKSDTHKKIARMLSQGYTYSMIANRLNCTKQYIGKCVKEMQPELEILRQHE